MEGHCPSGVYELLDAGLLLLEVLDWVAVGTGLKIGEYLIPSFDPSVLLHILPGITSQTEYKSQSKDSPHHVHKQLAGSR